jgi:monoamine oxidase
MKKQSIGIIGGGLTGLSAAYYLNKENISITIIEARDRLGGRIFTTYNENEAPVELGATWLGKKHQFLIDLLTELELEIFEQYMGKYAVYEPISTSPPQLVTMPYNPDPTYRIKGGSSALISQLANHLDSASIHLNTKAKALKLNDNKIILDTEAQTFEFDQVIVTLPPKLFLNTIEFSPPIPQNMIEVGQMTHTWMSESIKVALTYASPFWKEKNPVGSIFSNTGLISEMYDHTNYENSEFALKGFINGGFAFASQEERKQRVINQLSKYFGKQVEDYLSYQELIWRNEEFTHFDYDGFILPHQNNGNPIFQTALFEDKLHIGGAETAAHHPGYMDGAVESGFSLAKKIMNAVK